MRSMDCPRCGYVMNALDTECRRCHWKPGDTEETPGERSGQEGPKEEETDPASSADVPAASGDTEQSATPAQEAAARAGEEQPSAPGSPTPAERRASAPFAVATLWYTGAAVLLILGSVSPWLYVSFFGVNQYIHGTRVPLFHVGIWTLLSGLCIVCLLAMEHWGTKVSHHDQLLAVTTLASLTAVLAVPAYYLWFVHFGALDYGWYITLAAAVILVVRISRDNRLPGTKARNLGICIGLIVIACSIFLGWHDYRPIREAKAELAKLGGVSAGWLLKSPATSSIPFAAVPPEPSPMLPSGAQSPIPVFRPPVPPKPPPVQFTVNSWYSASQIGTGMFAQTASSGKTLMIADITVYNTGSEELYVSCHDFELVGSDGKVYRSRSHWFAMTESSLSAKLIPGGTDRGTVIFEVAQGVQPVNIRYSSLW